MISARTLFPRYHRAFAIQTIAIPDALAGRDVCGKARPDRAKPWRSACPSSNNRASRTQARCPALVPTRESPRRCRTSSAAPPPETSESPVYGGANIERQIKLEKGVDFVVATPGRMIDLVERNAVDLTDLTHVIVDEADRMADMGFLLQVEWLLRQVEGDHQTSCSRPRSTARSTRWSALPDRSRVPQSGRRSRSTR